LIAFWAAFFAAFLGAAFLRAVPPLFITRQGALPSVDALQEFKVQIGIEGFT
jgi:hypothetical protein